MKIAAIHWLWQWVLRWRYMTGSFFVAAFAAYMLIANPAVVQHMEGIALSLYFQWRGPVQPENQPVVIVSIDDKSIAAMGGWPWPHEKVLELSEKLLHEQSARIVATDLMLAASEPNPLTLSRSWFEKHKLPVPEVLDVYEAEASVDLHLADLWRSSGRVVQGFRFYDHTPRPGEMKLDPNVRQYFKRIIGSAFTHVRFIEGGKRDQMMVGPAIMANIPELATASRDGGFLNIINDLDGTVRYAPLIIRYHDAYFPELALDAVRAYMQEARMEATVTAKRVYAHVGERSLELDRHGRLWLSYYGPAGTFPTYSAVDILNGRVPTDALKDKLVFLGLDISSSPNRFPTPFGAMAGTEIQANIATNIINEDELVTPYWTQAFLWGMFLLIALGFGLLFKRLVIKTHGLTTMLLLLIYAVFSYQMFLNGVWIPLVTPVVQAFLTFTVLFGIYSLESFRERNRMRMAFDSFVDPDVINQTLEHPELLSLSGDLRDITIMFVDIEGFTSLAERLTPQEVVLDINRFFDAAIPIVLEAGGTIDRLTGDGFIALFGAPVSSGDHAIRACEAALDLQRALEPLRPVFEALNHPLRIRVGINSGEVVVGNFGSSKRLQYSFMGDAGNMAARFESLNKQYGSTKMLGEQTWQRVKDVFVCREVDSVVLVGKQEPSIVYELVGRKDQQSFWQPLLKDYAKALAEYRTGAFAQAEVLFRQAHEAWNDPVSLIMADRCTSLQKDIPENWQGVWHCKDK